MRNFFESVWEGLLGCVMGAVLFFWFIFEKNSREEHRKLCAEVEIQAAIWNGIFHEWENLRLKHKFMEKK